jgi:hypothetical protein
MRFNRSTKLGTFQKLLALDLENGADKIAQSIDTCGMNSKPKHVK